MEKKIENNLAGYIAITTDGKMLRNYWSGGSQTGTNKQSLTDNIRLATIDSKKAIEMYIDMFNNSHKKRVDFEIKSVVCKNIIIFEINDKEN